MSSRPLVPPFKALVNGDMSATTIVSIPSIISNVSMCSYNAVWTGTAPVGTLSVEVSNDYSQNAAGDVLNPGDWTTLPSLTQTITGNTGSAFLDIFQTGAFAIRLRYTKTSGVGTIQAFFNGKVA